MVPQIMLSLLLHTPAWAEELLLYSLIACNMRTSTFQGLNHPIPAKPGSSSVSRAYTQNHGVREMVPV